MTLLPVEEIRVTIPDQDRWVEEADAFLCSNPTCGHLASQTHHVVRRSATAGPKRWVAVDGLILLNEVRVCLWCHDDLNNHKAWIRYLTGEGWQWYAALAFGTRVGPSEERIGGLIQQPKSGQWFGLLGPLRSQHAPASQDAR